MYLKKCDFSANIYKINNVSDFIFFKNKYEVIHKHFDNYSKYQYYSYSVALNRVSIICSYCIFHIETQINN